MEACVERYKERCPPSARKFVKAETPFLDESKPEFDENPINPKVDKLFGQPSPMSDADVIAEQPCVLGDAAAAVLMKILYGARMGNE